MQINVHIENTGVEASINSDLDHAGDEDSSNAHQEKRSTRSSKKNSVLSEGKLSMIFVFFRQSLPVVNNFFFTVDYTNSGHDDSTLEPEDNTNPLKNAICENVLQLLVC